MEGQLFHLGLWIAILPWMPWTTIFKNGNKSMRILAVVSSVIGVCNILIGINKIAKVIEETNHLVAILCGIQAVVIIFLTYGKLKTEKALLTKVVMVSVVLLWLSAVFFVFYEPSETVMSCVLLSLALIALLLPFDIIEKKLNT